MQSQIWERRIDIGKDAMLADCSPNPTTSSAGLGIDPAGFYHALWHTSAHGMYAIEVLDKGEGVDFRFLAFNPGMVQLHLIPVAALQGKRLGDVLPSAIAETYRQHYMSCVRSQQMISFEEKLAVPSGDAASGDAASGDAASGDLASSDVASSDAASDNTWCHWRVFPIADAAGEVMQLIVTATDVTARRQAEEALRLQQQVIDAMPSVIIWKDLQSRFLGANRALLEIAGCETLADLIGKTDYDMPWKKEEADWFIECDQRVMSANQPEINIIEPQLQMDGRNAWLSTSKIPLHDAAGGVSGILCIAEDITAQKEVRDAQDRLLAILEATPDVVGIADAEGNNRYLNRAGQLIFGISAEQADQFHISEVTHPEVAEMTLTEAMPTAIAKGSWHGESLIRDCYGRDVPVSQVIICHKSAAGEVEYFSSIMRDISDLKAAEIILKQQSEDLSTALQQLKTTQAQIIQSEKMSSLGQMVAGVAHEINNPVNFIHGNLKPAIEYTQDLFMLIELYNEAYPDATPEIKSVLDEIDLDFVQQDLPKLLTSMSMGTQRIREIVLSLRNFSRLDESAVKTVDIHEGLDSTLVILNHRLKGDHPKSRIEVIKSYGQLPLIDCYPSQLNQVFMNILANALDALAQQPQPQITITTEVINDQVKICIGDNGPGIPKAIQSQILNPFFTTKPIGKGTGMGMSISYQIITEKHGGQLTFVSDEGQGTEFSMLIPIRKLSEDDLSEAAT